MATKEVEDQISKGLVRKERKGKLMWRNLPLKELQEVCKVFNYGASEEKYKAPFTYRIGKGLSDYDMFDANMRHLERIQAGELRAKDSKCLHWAHIAADALMEISKILIEQEVSMEDIIIEEEAKNAYLP
jgi:hypothetical protein